ncbi:hypothetical protein Y1Q_0000099 [Alligator mississippiensis]|uniref:Uncharacterized protein n=1 Tax=Alligator mississippiensis TaxID=8496 RepID=A0A151NQH1_ALLMI|nr:hypothetical protein Y1Q_0000099 [Alligator mississippiensis]
MISKEDRGQWPQLSSRTSFSLDSREERPRHCPVWFPQLHTQKWPWVLPALQSPPGHPGPPQRPVWVRAPLRLHPPCRPENGDVGRGDMPRDKTQGLIPDMPGPKVTPNMFICGKSLS